MIRALREYIIELKKDILEAALAQLKKNLDFDSTAIDHLHLALYSFQDAVITVLRKHNIKPHWMFALDNLVKSSVQAGITVLSPELGANLAGQVDIVEEEDDIDEDEDVSSSGVSTVNSAKVLITRATEKGTFGVLAGISSSCGDELNSLRSENLRLTRDLIESQRQLQNFLKTAVEEQNVNVDFIKTFLGQRPQFERCISQGYFSDRGINNNNNNNEVQIKVTNDGEQEQESPVDMELTTTPDSIDGAGDGGGTSAVTNNNNNNAHPSYRRQLPVNGMRRSPTRNNRRLIIQAAAQNNCDSLKFDSRLNEWLLRQNVDAISRNMIQMQDFSYEDFLYELGKDDLLRIGLK